MNEYTQNEKFILIITNQNKEILHLKQQLELSKENENKLNQQLELSKKNVNELNLANCKLKAKLYFPIIIYIIYLLNKYIFIKYINEKPISEFYILLQEIFDILI
jgi:hypothetical protein